MNNTLAGNDLTRSILERGKEEVWCAVSNHSNERAMITVNNADYDFLRFIISFEDGFFFSEEGSTWRYTVPIKTKALIQDEVGL